MTRKALIIFFGLCQCPTANSHDVQHEGNPVSLKTSPRIDPWLAPQVELVLRLLHCYSLTVSLFIIEYSDQVNS